MASTPTPVKVGDLISAEQFNALVEGVRRSLTITAGAGLAVQQSTGGIGLALLANLSKYAVEGIITAAPEGDDVRIEDAVYDAQPVGQSDARLTSIAPRFGRTFANGVRVRPARVGDPCIILRLPVVREDRPDGSTADLWVFSEQVLTHVCQPAPGGSGGAGGAGGGSETPPPPPPLPPPVTPPESSPPAGGEA